MQPCLPVPRQKASICPQGLKKGFGLRGSLTAVTTKQHVTGEHRQGAGSDPSARQVGQAGGGRTPLSASSAQSCTGRSVPATRPGKDEVLEMATPSAEMSSQRASSSSTRTLILAKYAEVSATSGLVCESVMKRRS